VMGVFFFTAEIAENAERKSVNNCLRSLFLFLSDLSGLSGEKKADIVIYLFLSNLYSLSLRVLCDLCGKKKEGLN
jgi:hypothetical protein